MKVFEANIIYHLFDQFTEYVKQVEEERKREALKAVVFPCLLKVRLF